MARLELDQTQAGPLQQVIDRPVPMTPPSSRCKIGVSPAQQLKVLVHYSRVSSSGRTSL